MPRYRMIAIDLDGTLLSPAGEVTPRVRAAVHRAFAAGFLICFATGRNWTESRMVIEAVGHHGTAVFVGGAMVVDTDTGVMLQRSLMAPELARALSAVFEDEGHAVLALQDRGTAGIDYVVTEAVPLDESTARWMSVTASKVERYPRLADHPHDHTMRVGIVAAVDESRRVRDRLRREFGDRITCHSLYVSAYDVEVLEVFDPAVNKWEGILHVARRHGVDPAEIVAVGDDTNDVPMLRNAGLGVAMGNARPEAMAAATRVIKTNADEGLAEFLDELVDARLAEATGGGGVVA